MPTNKPRVMVTVSDDVYQKIENYRYENRFKSQSLAVSDLISKGIQAILGPDNVPVVIESEPAAPILTDDETELIRIFRDLNDKGQDALLRQARYLVSDPDMKKGAVSNTATA